MDLSDDVSVDNPPRMSGNQPNRRQQHQYVNDGHKPSSQLTAPIDLSRPLAPVYPCNVPVISQTRGPVIVTADHAPPPSPTWHANDGRRHQSQSQPSNIRPPPPIYEISSSDDDTAASDQSSSSSRLVIDEYVDGPKGREIEVNSKEALINSARMSMFSSNSKKEVLRK
jgi:hypothetical protein